MTLGSGVVEESVVIWILGGLCFLAVVAVGVVALVMLARKGRKPAPPASAQAATDASPAPSLGSSAGALPGDASQGRAVFEAEDENATDLAGILQKRTPGADGMSAQLAGPAGPGNRVRIEPPSHKRMNLETMNLPDVSQLQPGATIIPPDDWNEDYIDEEEADETMLMARPPLPPKK